MPLPCDKPGFVQGIGSGTTFPRPNLKSGIGGALYRIALGRPWPFDWRYDCKSDASVVRVPYFDTQSRPPPYNPAHDVANTILSRVASASQLKSEMQAIRGANNSHT